MRRGHLQHRVLTRAEARLALPAECQQGDRHHALKSALRFTLVSMRYGMRVGELAEQAGLSAPTIRFYERAGLLAPPRRSEAGYRLYEPEVLDSLRFIARAKALGLSLAKIRLMQEQPDAEPEHRQLRHLIAHQLVRTRRQQRELRALEDALMRLFGALADQPGQNPGQRRRAAPGPAARSWPRWRSWPVRRRGSRRPRAGAPAHWTRAAPAAARAARSMAWPGPAKRRASRRDEACT